MNTKQALFIRALKSSSADFRLKRLYKRYYCNDFNYRHGVSILREIIDSYKLMNTVDWVDGLNPENSWKYGVGSANDYYELCFRVMSSHIRLTSVSSLPGYPTARKFK